MNNIECYITAETFIEIAFQIYNHTWCFFRAGSLNRSAIAAADATATAAANANSTAAKKTWNFKSYSKITLGITRKSPRESLFKDRYFVSGRGIGSDSGIATRF